VLTFHRMDIKYECSIVLCREQSTFWKSTSNAPNGVRSTPSWPVRSACRKSNSCWSSSIRVDFIMPGRHISSSATGERYEQLTDLDSNCGAPGTTMRASLCRRKFPAHCSTVASTPTTSTSTILSDNFLCVWSCMKNANINYKVIARGRASLNKELDSHGRGLFFFLCKGRTPSLSSFTFLSPPFSSFPLFPLPSL